MFDNYYDFVLIRSIMHKHSCESIKLCVPFPGKEPGIQVIFKISHPDGPDNPMILSKLMIDNALIGYMVFGGTPFSRSGNHHETMFLNLHEWLLRKIGSAGLIY